MAPSEPPKKSLQTKRLWQKAFKSIKTGVTAFEEPFHILPAEDHSDSLIQANGGRIVDCSGRRLVVFNFHGKRFTREHLDDSDNTGNARVWLSEECLASYIAGHSSNPSIRSRFANKRILELGSGKTGLAGLCAASFMGTVVHITDGNERAVENVRRIVAANNLRNVETYKLDWSQPPEDLESFDVIIASDCVYFERYHCIVDCIEKLLSEDGTVYMTAPERKGTLELFLSKLDRSKWDFIVVKNADWNKTLQKLQTDTKKIGLSTDYDEDQHSPRLVILNRVIRQ